MSPSTHNPWNATAPRPFASSPLWAWQRAYFEEAAVAAWGRGEVPQYVTSNPFAAQAAARVIAAFLEECPGDPHQPVHVLELGAGSGAFAYRLLKALNRITDRPFVYVLSDFVEETLRFWEAHPRLQPFFADGSLETARFDAAEDAHIILRQSRRHIDPAGLTRPLVVVANYFFDGIPQELVYVHKGRAHPVWLGLHEPDPSASQSERLARCRPVWTYAPTPCPPLGSAYADTLLRHYTTELHAGHVLLPLQGIACIDRLRALAPAGLVLLTADKGLHRLEGWQLRPPPQLTRHGSVSITANYHALAHHCAAAGGFSLFPRHASDKLNIGLLAYMTGSLPRTEAAFRDHMEAFGPDDFFTVKKEVETRLHTLALPELFAYLRLSAHDPRLFHQCMPRFDALVPSFDPAHTAAFLQLAARVWDQTFPLPGEDDLALDLAVLLIKLACIEEALAYLRVSLLTAETADGLYYQAWCLLHLGREVAGMQALRRLLETHPRHREGLQLAAQVQAVFTQRLAPGGRP